VKLDSYRANKTSIKFSFSLHDYNHLAECNIDTLQISVSESYWLTASDLEREELVFHELGHCILGRGHEDGAMPISGGSIYKSLMNSYGDALMQRFPNGNNCANNASDCGYDLIFAPKSKNNFYSKYHKIYMDELFGVVAPNQPSVTKTSVKVEKTAANSAPTPTPSPVFTPKGKLKKGMSRQEVVAVMGDPINVSERSTGPGMDTWDNWQFRSPCCQSTFSTCFVMFVSETHQVVKWDDIKPECTDYMGE
jgi:hypothetical protein